MSHPFVSRFTAKTQPFAEQWVLMSDNVRSEYLAEGFIDPTMPAAPVPPNYRKGTLEAKLDSLLPDWASFDVIAHELWGDGDGGYSVNDSWHLGRGCDRAEAISHLRNRWEVYKVNYEPKARVSDLTNTSCDSESPCYLEAGHPFAEVRNASPSFTEEARRNAEDDRAENNGYGK